MKEFIYVLRPTRLAMLTEGPTPAEAASLQGHVAHLAELEATGHATLFGRTQTADESTFGIVLLSASTAEDARHMMQQDPAVSSGTMSATLHPFLTSGGAWAPQA